MGTPYGTTPNHHSSTKHTPSHARPVVAMNSIATFATPMPMHMSAPMSTIRRSRHKRFDSAAGNRNPGRSRKAEGTWDSLRRRTRNRTDAERDGNGDGCKAYD